MFLKCCRKFRSNGINDFSKLSGQYNNAAKLFGMRLMMGSWTAETLIEIREPLDSLISSLDQTSKRDSDSEDWIINHRIIADNLIKHCEYNVFAVWDNSCCSSLYPQISYNLLLITVGAEP
jgi:hypothetical protein